MTSTNSSFLAKGHGPLVLQLAEAAERPLAVDPDTTLLKLRQPDEAFTQHSAAAVGVWTGLQRSQANLLRVLDRKSGLKRQVLELFHSPLRMGNDAAYAFTGSRNQAVSA